MQKQIGSTLLIAGTCIGSGMIALPMMLAKLGILPSIGLMLFIWLLMYYASIVNVELNLQAGHGISLGSLGRKFSGHITGLIGDVGMKVLSVALLSAFIYGGSSIMHKMIGEEYSLLIVQATYSICVLALLSMPIKIVDHINKVLFIGLIIIFFVLLSTLSMSLSYDNLPLVSENIYDWKSWSLAIPVVFTSFGFNAVIHTVTNYCDNNARKIKKAFLIGSFIPAVIYIIWTCSVLSIISHNDPAMYQKIAAGDADVSDLIDELSDISESPLLQSLVWWISSLAIVTSAIGVGLGLSESLRKMVFKERDHKLTARASSAFATVLPPFIVAAIIPNAFIQALGFAGMILVVVAVLMPIYLLIKIKGANFHYTELNKKWLISLAAIIGFVIIACEVVNIFFR